MVRRHTQSPMTDALVAAIRAASGGNELPARIGTTADDLASLAASRCEANPALADLCNALHSGRDDAVCDGDGHGFGDDDAKVIAFFLARSRTARSLECVSASGEPHPGSCAVRGILCAEYADNGPRAAAFAVLIATTSGMAAQRRWRRR